MGYLTPSLGGELDYGTGTGAVTLSWSAALVDANDILVLSVEHQGGDAGANPSGGWTFIRRNSTGTGTGHAGASMYVRRADGTETGVTVPDTGNHTSASVCLYRNIDRNDAFTAWVDSQAGDTGADTNQRSQTVNGSTAGVAVGQQFAVHCFTAGADNHGGSTNSLASTGTGWLGSLNDIRSGGHTAGSDGSHWTRAARGTSTSTDRQWQMVTANSMREQRMTLYMPAHEYTEYTRSVSDGLTSSDSIGRDAGYTRAIADSLGLSETLVRVGGFTRGVADSLGLADAVARVQGFVRGVSDSLTASDGVSRVQGFIRGLADSLGLADAVSTDKVLYRLVSDALGLSDAVARVKGQYRNVVDSLALSDALAQVLVAGIKAAITSAVKALTRVARSVGVTTTITASVDSNDITASTVETTEITTDVDSTDIEVAIE